MSRIRINRTREELLDMQRVRQNRYYEKNKERFRIESMSGKWKKNCPACNKEIVYTTKSNLEKSIQKQLPCRSCGQRLRPYEALFNALLYKCKQRNISCELTYEQFLEYTNVNACKYCLGNIEWLRHNIYGQKLHWKFNLDRMDNSKGYSKENCCVCCSICNGVKSNVFSYEDMVQIGNTLKQLREQKYGTS